MVQWMSRPARTHGGGIGEARKKRTGSAGLIIGKNPPLCPAEKAETGGGGSMTNQELLYRIDQDAAYIQEHRRFLRQRSSSWTLTIR